MTGRVACRISIVSGDAAPASSSASVTGPRLLPSNAATTTLRALARVSIVSVIRVAGGLGEASVQATGPALRR